MNVQLVVRQTAPRLILALAMIATAQLAHDCQAQSVYRTANFVVRSQQPAFSKQVGELAEKYRKELAELWLGEELPQWPQPCPITVKFERLAGGETSFAFAPGPDGRSQPFDWRMKIYGTPERILDSVLPHEITHTIFATHYGRPLPRWADEGACTTVEHVEEREKNHQMLMQFLRSNRGIPFNHMFAMKQYPRDILPLYAQGYSLAKYLIQQKGHRHYINFVGEGMDREVPGREPQTWNDVARKYYGYQDLSDLQVRWLAWVKDGCPDLSRTDVAAVSPAKTPAPKNVAAGGTRPSPVVPTQVAAGQVASAVVPVNLQASTELNESESWYVRQSRLGGNATMQRPDNRGSLQDQQQYLPGSLRNTMATPAKSATKWR